MFKKYSLACPDCNKKIKRSKLDSDQRKQLKCPYCGHDFSVLSKTTNQNLEQSKSLFSFPNREYSDNKLYIFNSLLMAWKDLDELQRIFENKKTIINTINKILKNLISYNFNIYVKIKGNEIARLWKKCDKSIIAPKIRKEIEKNVTTWKNCKISQTIQTCKNRQCRQRFKVILINNNPDSAYCPFCHEYQFYQNEMASPFKKDDKPLTHQPSQPSREG